MNKAMNTFYWLVKREYWEHRGGFFWAPLISAGVVIVLHILSIIALFAMGSHHPAEWQKINTASPHDLQQIGGLLDINALVPTIIIAIVMFFVLYSYCLKSLSADRSDRSILFWKSLPLSDTSTVLSKVFCAIILAPVIAFVIGAVSALIMLIITAIAAAFVGAGFFHTLFGISDPGHVMLAIIGGLPVFWIWMLPAVGWFMMCSAYCSGKAWRWAIALPLVVGVLFSWIGWLNAWGDAIGWFWRHVILRALLSLLPGSSLLATGIDQQQLHITAHNGHLSGLGTIGKYLDQSVAHSYAAILTPDFLWGALVGIIMIAAAIWLRRWRTEL